MGAHRPLTQPYIHTRYPHSLEDHGALKWLLECLLSNPDGRYSYTQGP